MEIIKILKSDTMSQIKKFGLTINTLKSNQIKSQKQSYLDCFEYYTW